MKTKQVFYLSTFALALTFGSCKKNDPVPVVTPPAAAGYDNGVFIINQGMFTGGTGTVSFYSRSSSSVSNDIFMAKNNYPLGNIAQSMEIYNNTGYIVVNNAGKVETVDGSTFASKGAITGLTSPRYFLGINNTTGYVSQWGSTGGSIKVIDLNSKTVTATIPTGNGAEEMVKAGNFVYAACCGGFGNDSVVTVINSATNTVLTNINAGPNPQCIKVDANGKIWVLCIGQWDQTFTTLVKPGRLVRIDASTNTIDFSLPFSSTTSQPMSLVTNTAKTILYYTYNGKVYSQACASTSLSASAVINRNFYGLGIDPANDYLYGADAGNYTSSGKVLRYTASGAAVDSFAVGIIPGYFCFK